MDLLLILNGHTIAVESIDGGMRHRQLELKLSHSWGI